MTFVSLGNSHQPFTRLLEAVVRIRAQLPGPVFVQHGHTPLPPELEGRAFLTIDEYEHHMRGAQLVICQAGGGGVLLAVEAGKVPVVMPRRVAFGENVDDHQVANAHELEKANRVVVADSPDDLPAAVRRALSRQNSPEEKPGVSALVVEIDRLLAAYAERN